MGSLYVLTFKKNSKCQSAPPRVELKFNDDEAARGELGLVGITGVWNKAGEVLFMFSKHVGIIDSNKVDVLATFEAVRIFSSSFNGSLFGEMNTVIFFETKNKKKSINGTLFVESDSSIGILGFLLRIIVLGSSSFTSMRSNGHQRSKQDLIMWAGQLIGWEILFPRTSFVSFRCLYVCTFLLISLVLSMKKKFWSQL